MQTPKPKKDEGRHTFITRFIQDPDMKAKYPDAWARCAAAKEAWEQAKEKKNGDK